MKQLHYLAIALFVSMGTSYTMNSLTTISLRMTTRLHRAAANGDLKTCRSLVQTVRCIDAQDKDGNTPLHLAAASGHYSVCELLLSWGANKFAENCYRQTPYALVPNDETDSEDDRPGIVFAFENSARFDLENLLKPSSAYRPACGELVNTQETLPSYQPNSSLGEELPELAMNPRDSQGFVSCLCKDFDDNTVGLLEQLASKDSNRI